MTHSKLLNDYLISFWITNFIKLNFLLLIMSTGFGCMVVGPAGSGKVIIQIDLTLISQHSVTYCKKQENQSRDHIRYAT